MAVVLYHARMLPQPFGNIGVQMFFALSGFLITSLLVEEHERFGRIRLGRFYLRRVLRLFPALVVMLLAFVAYRWLTSPRAAALAATRQALTALFYWTNWACTAGPLRSYSLGHTWSLGIEEQFYLIWPPLLIWLLGHTRSRASMLNWMLLGCYAAAINRWLLFARWPDPWRIDFGTDTQADSLLWGCAAAIALESGLLPRGRKAQAALAWAAVASLAGLIYLGSAKPWKYGLTACVGYPLISFLCMLMVLGLVAAPAGPLAQVLSHPIPSYIGKISYGIYLWHVPVFLETQSHEWPLAKVLAVEFGLAAAAVLASYYFLERPLLRLKARLRDWAPARGRLG
jgi:peptidoglycan/LPS O-acetylase OafA/YrhL